MVRSKLSLRLALAAAAILVAGAAFAARPQSARAEAVAFHLHLLRSAPAADSTVAAPAEVKLWFTEAPELAVTTVRLARANGTPVRLSALHSERNNAVSAHVTGTLAPGRYNITWRTMSHDGHPMRGTIPFTVRR
jgi:methionine-rich copper-binding protein CopC